LRINDQGVSLGGTENRTILHRDFIRGKILIVPVSNLSRVGQNEEGIGFRAHGDVVLLKERYELFLHNLVSELLVEGSDVRNEGRGKQDISDNLGDTIIQLNDSVSPTGAFRTESSNKTVSHIELGSTLGGFSLSSFLIIHDFLELVLQDLKSSVQLSDFKLDSS
jgi:hypothetical protein